MRLRNLQRLSWAAWLGVAALGLYALVPIHLAFDLAEAFGAAHEEGTLVGSHDAERGLLGLLSGHLGGSSSGHHHKHHRHDCPVCSSLASLAGFASAASPVLPIPVFAAAAAVVAAIPGTHNGAPALAYRPRAPPFA